MAQYRGTVFFSWQSFGWTESYYLVGSAPGSAGTNLMAIVTPRLALSRPDVIAERAVLSDIAVRGDSILQAGFPLPGTNADTGTTQIPDVCLLMHWKVGVFNRNKTFLRGYPLAVAPAGGYAPPFGYVAEVTAYVNAVIANAVMPAITGPNPTPPPKYLYTYSPILAGIIGSNVHRRKTGRPFGLPRGRRVSP